MACHTRMTPPHPMLVLELLQRHLQTHRTEATLLPLFLGTGVQPKS